MFKKSLFMAINIILFCSFCYAQGSETVTITTYYPAACGVYEALRLFPATLPVSCEDGELHYDATPGNEGVYYCDGGAWYSVSGSLWTLIGNDLFPSSKDWNVGIGVEATDLPLIAKLQFKGSLKRLGSTGALGTQINLGINSNTVNPYSTVGGGQNNRATDSNCLVGGGYDNEASNNYATIAGGYSNTSSNPQSTVGGGQNNSATITGSTVIGGLNNSTLGGGFASLVSGGSNNTVSGGYSVYSAVVGGYSNATGGSDTVVVAGRENTAAAQFAFAAGRGAQANNQGAFVWADSTEDLAGNTIFYSSTVANSFNVRASNGLYFSSCSVPTCPAWDIAEFMDALKTEQPIEEDYIVSVVANDKLAKSTQAYDEKLIGVVSGKKTTSMHLGNKQPAYEDTVKLPIALAGRVFVKVNNENGSIGLGDPITSSLTPGIGMRATETGKIIGHALEEIDFKDKPQGEVLVFVNLGWYFGKTKER